MGEIFGWATSAFVFILIVGTLIAAIPIDHSGVQPGFHRGSVPVSVVQLSDKAYLAPPNIDPNWICKQADANGASVNVIRFVSRARANFVDCAADQRWNVHGKISQNYGRALGTVWSSPVTWIVTGVVAAICYAAWVYALLGSALDIVSSRKANRNKLEEQKRALTKAWSNGDIELDEYEKKWDELTT